jgi:hypothetical protein
MAHKIRVTSLVVSAIIAGQRCDAWMGYPGTHGVTNETPAEAIIRLNGWVLNDPCELNPSARLDACDAFFCPAQLHQVADPQRALAQGASCTRWGRPGAVGNLFFPSLAGATRAPK